MLKQSPSLNLAGSKFKRFGFMKVLYQEFPPLNNISSDENAVSLVFLRRVPSRTVLRQLEKVHLKVILRQHGIVLERIRITNQIIIAHQRLMRVKLRGLAWYTRNPYLFN